MTKIAIIVGSLRTGSINKILAKNLEALAPDGTEFVYVDINLPLFNQDMETNYPAEVADLKATIESSDGVLIITPEHNRSFSAATKNTVDWASRPYTHNSFKGKPIGIIGASSGQTGTAQAQSHIRNSMVYLDTKIMGQPELYVQTKRTFDDNGQVVEVSREYLQNYIKALVDYINKNK